MKHQELTPDTPATLQYTPEFQDKPLTIRGDYDVLLGVNSDLEALEARLLAQNDKVSASVGKTAVTAPEVPTVHYELPSRRERVAQFFADRKLRQFDKYWNTDLYDKKQDQRRKTAIFLMASEADLFDHSSQYYKAQLKRLAK